MGLFTITPANPNVNYAGKTIPGDKVPFTPPVPDPNVPYNGATIPAQKVKYQPVPVDLTNLPSLCVLGTLASVANSSLSGTVVSAPTITGTVLSNGGIVLPGDVVIRGDVEKIVADLTIIDGVEVSQGIRRGAQNIEIEFTARAKNGSDYIFAQAFLNALYANIVLPLSVIYVQNTLFNGMGIQQLILKKFNYDTIRGNINIPIILRFKENIPGQSLIV